MFPDSRCRRKKAWTGKCHRHARSVTVRKTYVRLSLQISVEKLPHGTLLDLDSVYVHDGAEFEGRTNAFVMFKIYDSICEHNSLPNLDFDNGYVGTANFQGVFGGILIIHQRFGFVHLTYSKFVLQFYCVEI